MQNPIHPQLDPHADQVQDWIETENVTLEEARQRLSDLGCPVTRADLADWWNARQSRRAQRQLLDLIANAASQCREVELDLGSHPAPELETLISLHRVLVFKLSAQANATPELLRLVTDSLKPALEWAKLQEKQKNRLLAEQKHRDALEAQKRAREELDPNPDGGLRPETIAKIERELNLL